MFNKRQLLVKERIGSFYIYDPDTGAQIGLAREKKRPFQPTIEVSVSDGSPVVLTIKRSFSLLGPRFVVLDAGRKHIGSLKGPFLSFGHGFDVLDRNGNKVAEFRPDTKSGSFILRCATGEELGRVTRRVAWVGKELFPSASDYMIALSDSATPSGEVPALLLAGALAIDIVLIKD